MNGKTVKIELAQDGNGNVPEVITAEFPDTPKYGQITIVKTDSVKNKPVVGAKFDIIATTDMAYPDGTHVIKAGTTVQSDLTTGADGTATSKKLQLGSDGIGHYKVVETYAPPSYVITQKEYDATITWDDDTSPIAFTTVTPKNDVATLKLKVTKKDSETEQPIANVEFDIRANADIKLSDGSTIYSKNEVIGHVKTGADGTASYDGKDTGKKLYFSSDGKAHYEFVETKVPVPYTSLNAEKVHDVTVTYTAGKAEYSNETTYKNMPEKGRIKVVKTSTLTGKPIQGAKFDVVATKDIHVNGDKKVSKDEVVQKDLTTGADGTATSNEFYIDDDGTGYYKLVETFVPKPFVLVQDEYKVNIPFESDQVFVTLKTVDVKNKPAWGTVSIEKKEDVTGGPVEGAVFNVVADKDIVFPNGEKPYNKDQVVDTITTNKEGKTSSTKPLYLDQDGKGNYRLVEVDVGKPYYITEETTHFELTYKDFHTEKVYTSVNISNGVQSGKASIKKTEEALKSDIEATFDVKAAKDIVLPNGKVIYKKDDTVQTIKTNEKGEVTTTTPLYLDKDGKGNYYFYETDTGGVPLVFPAAGQRYDFELNYTNNKSATATVVNAINVENRVAKFPLELTKTDAEDGSPLDGAVFEIHAEEDIVLPNGKTPYKKDQLVETITTNKDGKVKSTEPLWISKTGLGKYYLKEIDAPEGHAIAKEPYHVVGKYVDQNTPIVVKVECDAPNKPNELDLNKSVLSKDGKTFDDEVVEGATFRLWKKEDELPVTPQAGKDAYALRIDGGDEGHDVVLTKPVGYAELALADGISGYTLAVRDAKGNMTKVGTEDAPAQVKTNGEDGLDLDVIVSDAAGKAVSGITGDRRITVHDGDRVVLDLDGVKKVETNDNTNDNTNENDTANGNGNTNDSTKTVAVVDAENDNANGDANASNENANANADASASAISVKADFSHVKDSSLEPTVTSGAYIFDNLEPDTTYNVMVDKKVVYRLATSDTSTEGTSNKADNDSDADADAGTDTTNKEQPDNDSTDKDTEDDTQTDTGTTAGGKVYYGRLDTTASHYAYKRQPMLLTSDDKFIDKFTINGKDYPVETKTDAEGKIIIKRIKTGEYGFGEVDVPFVGDKGKDGSDRSYLINTNVFRFTVDGTTGRLNDEEVLVNDVTDDWTQVDLSKNEITGGPEIPGAHLEIRDRDDKVVEEWTSTDMPHRVDRLTPGKYTLVEVMTPNNYDQATRVEFTVYDTGEVQKVEMHDQPIQINAKIDKRQEIADPVAENTEPNGDGKNKAEVTKSDEGKFRYSLDYKNDSTTWVDEFTVYDPLDGVAQGLARLNGLTTAQAYQDFDGKMNVWFQTNKTSAEYDGDVSKANATKDDGHVNQWLVNSNDDIKSRDTDGDGRILSYTGWRLWKKDVSVTQATTLSVSGLGLASDEYVTGIRLEYGRVEKGFTTRPDGWDRTDLKDEHDDMKPIEQIHKDTFTGTSRDAVLSRLALMRSFVASVADGIESKDVAGDDSSQTGNENADANANDMANGNVSTMGVADAQNGSESADENANDAGDENASAGASDAAVSLVGEVSAALDRCEERVREALDAQDDAAVSKAMHDARNEVVRLVDAVMAESSASKDTLTAMVAAVDAAYGSVSAGLDEATAKDAKAGIDEARHAATANDAAVVRKNLGNAISDAIDGLVMSESYGRILKSDEVANNNSTNATDGNVSSNENTASKEDSATGTDASNAIHYSATILDMQVTDAYVPGTNLDNSAYVDAYRNGGGEGLEGHDNDKVTQTPRMADLASDLLAQTGDGTSLMAILSGTAAAIATSIALRHRELSAR